MWRKVFQLGQNVLFLHGSRALGLGVGGNAGCVNCGGEDCFPWTLGLLLDEAPVVRGTAGAAQTPTQNRPCLQAAPRTPSASPCSALPALGLHRGLASQKHASPSNPQPDDCQIRTRGGLQGLQGLQRTPKDSRKKPDRKLGGRRTSLVVQFLRL